MVAVARADKIGRKERMILEVVEVAEKLQRSWREVGEKLLPVLIIKEQCSSIEGIQAVLI